MNNEKKTTKFRAWDKERSSYLFPLTTTFHFGEHGFEGVESRSSRAIFLQPNHVVLEQFIGITDKVGKDVYAGDIIIYCGIYFLVVVKEEYGLKCFIEGIEYNECYTLSRKLSNSIEVVGNVHENREFIK